MRGWSRLGPVSPRECTRARAVESSRSKIIWCRLWASLIATIESNGDIQPLTEREAGGAPQLSASGYVPFRLRFRPLGLRCAAHGMVGLWIKSTKCSSVLPSLTLKMSGEFHLVTAEGTDTLYRELSERNIDLLISGRADRFKDSTILHWSW